MYAQDPTMSEYHRRVHILFGNIDERNLAHVPEEVADLIKAPLDVFEVYEVEN